MAPSHYIAQINVARMLEPLDSPVIAEFVARLDEINALAEVTPGFIWRLQGSQGNATSIKVFDDDMMILNMSVWDGIDALYQYTYYSAHAEVYRKRGEWFSKMEAPHLALWWVPASHRPTALEGKERLEHLHIRGASAHAFTFKTRFEPVDLKVNES